MAPDCKSPNSRCNASKDHRTARGGARPLTRVWSLLARGYPPLTRPVSPWTPFRCPPDRRKTTANGRRFFLPGGRFHVTHICLICMRFHTLFFTHIMRFCSIIFLSIYALISTTKKQSKLACICPQIHRLYRRQTISPNDASVFLSISVTIPHKTRTTRNPIVPGRLSSMGIFGGGWT